MVARIRWNVLPLFAALSLLPLSRLAGQASLVPIPILATSGQGEAKLTPDRAAVNINVQTRATSAATAAADNATRTRAVLDALGKLGLPKDQLATEGYTVYPEMQYDKNGGTPRVSAYVVTNTVRAETKRPEQAGAMVDAALGAGANMINGLSFYAASIDEARRQAIAIAVASARPMRTPWRGLPAERSEA